MEAILRAAIEEDQKNLISIKLLCDVENDMR